jgi:hypothetical protein
MEVKRIVEKNMFKITNPVIDTVLIIFPYNQRNLFVPDEGDWRRILKDIKENVIIIASPNGLKKSRPDIPDSRLIITVNEMIFNYWKEIRNYIEANQKIKNIKIVTSDIDIERVKRDYNLVFSDSDKKFNVSYLMMIVQPSLWKKIYQIREKIVLMLPIKLYEALGEFR